jgi:hypothetical protein
LSTQDSGHKSVNNKISLAEKAKQLFSGLDHVAHVKHFEGVEIQEFITAVRTLLEKKNVKFVDDMERLRGKNIYTNIAELQPEGQMILWLTATPLEGVGILLDIRIIHTTELSAVADEQLTLLVEEIQSRLVPTS